MTAQTFGFAAGMDYHFSPNTVVGFALAGGGTNWGLANALGSGRSDAFQVGDLRHQLARPGLFRRRAGLHQSLVHNQPLGARRSAHRELRRPELWCAAGRRVPVGALPTLGVTPYGAVQAQDFHTPAYSESE